MAATRSTSAPDMKPMRNISLIPIVNARGQALVELALLLPVLLLLIIGSIEFGRAFFLKNRAINAAREGARAGVVSAASNYSTDITTAVHRIVPSITPGIDPPSAPTTKGAPVTVTVKVRFNTIVPNFIFPFKNFSSVTGRATMRYEGL